MTSLIAYLLVCICTPLMPIQGHSLLTCMDKQLCTLSNCFVCRTEATFSIVHFIFMVHWGQYLLATGMIISSRDLYPVVAVIVSWRFHPKCVISRKYEPVVLHDNGYDTFDDIYVGLMVQRLVMSGGWARVESRKFGMPRGNFINWSLPNSVKIVVL